MRTTKILRVEREEALEEAQEVWSDEEEFELVDAAPDVE